MVISIVLNDPKKAPGETQDSLITSSGNGRPGCRLYAEEVEMLAQDTSLRIALAQIKILRTETWKSAGRLRMGKTAPGLLSGGGSAQPGEPFPEPDATSRQAHCRNQCVVMTVFF